MSVQHINLIDAALLPPKARYTAVQGLIAWGVLVVVLGISAVALQWAAAKDSQRAAALHVSLPALQAQGATPSAGAAVVASHAHEMAELRQREAALQGLLSVLDGGAAGRPQGYSDYLQALARQASSGEGAPRLWLTGFKIDGSGRQLDLSGRMTDASALPDYLRRLNAEPLFQGRSFAELQVHADETLNKVSDFTLRATDGQSGADAANLPAAPVQPALQAGAKP